MVGLFESVRFFALLCSFVVLICMQAMTHSADNVPSCARAVELVVAGPCFVVQCWFGSFLADQLQ